MKRIARAQFTIKSWDEKPFSESDGLPKLTRATVTKTLTGDIEGEGHVEYLMTYLSDGSETKPGRSCCSAPAFLKTALRKRPTRSSLAPAQDTCKDSRATAIRLSD